MCPNWSILILAVTWPALVSLAPATNETATILENSTLELVLRDSGNGTGPELDCEQGWSAFGDKCYMFHSDMDGANFHNAITICERVHRAQLLTVHSETENKFLAWLLFEQHKLKFSAWIGIVRVDNDTFVWLDRTPFDYTNWAAGEPNNWNSKHYCVVLSTDSGLWYDVSCATHFVVVCEKPKMIGELHREEVNIVHNISLLHEELELLSGNVSAIQSQVGTVTYLIDLNFILVVVIIFLLLALMLVYAGIRRRSNKSNFLLQTSSELKGSPESSDDREKLWNCVGSTSSVDSLYVPTRLNRLCRATLKRFKSTKVVNSWSNDIRPTHTRRTTEDSSSNVATSI